jgi:hypothetical protein
VPVLAASGWADGYSNAVFRLLANLQVPRKGLIGPWSHLYPHVGRPGPAIGFLQEALRWWDRWLKGIDTGVEREPMLRVWMQDSVSPHPSYELRPGRWVAEPTWPSSGVTLQYYPMDKARLVSPGDSVEPEGVTVQSPLSVGFFAGKWCSYSAPPDLPHDQREEDGGALVFDTEPLSQRLEILGAPVLELEVSVDQPVAMIAARLSDLGPRGEATRVTYGLLNLTHRDGHESPEPLVPGRRYRVRLQLNDIAQRFPEGHRIRVSLSTSYFPLAWPPPEPVQLTVYMGVSRLGLPVRPPRSLDEQLRPFEEPEGARPLRVKVVEPPRHRWRVERDLAADVSMLEVVKDDGIKHHPDTGLEIRRATTEWYSYRRGDFDSVRGEVRSTRGFRRGDWAVRTETRTVLTSDAECFRIHATLDAYENEERVFSRDWSRQIPRSRV